MEPAALPDGYGVPLEQLKAEDRSARVRAVRAVNGELLELYWRIGRLILDRREAQGWGGKVIERLAEDLRAEFPEMRGLSRSYLFYMRGFAAGWPAGIVQQPVGRLPWGHVTVLLDRLDQQPLRNWYAARADEHAWSRNVLDHMIGPWLHLRQGRRRPSERRVAGRSARKTHACSRP